MAKTKHTHVQESKPEPFFEVEKLLSKRILKGKAQYLIKWKGYSD